MRSTVFPLERCARYFDTQHQHLLRSGATWIWMRGRSIWCGQRLGRIKLSRLLALRLTELEVHEGDLIHGARPNKWNPEFVRVCLPLRIAWLAEHHRQHRDANCRIQGRWVLKTDWQSWLVSASEADVVCTAADDNVEADVAISGDAADLLAFLLGRSPSSPVTVTGGAMLADRFKEAFPGP